MNLYRKIYIDGAFFTIYNINLIAICIIEKLYICKTYKELLGTAVLWYSSFLVQNRLTVPNRRTIIYTNKF